jgi:hypothetical protein
MNGRTARCPSGPQVRGGQPEAAGLYRPPRRTNARWGDEPKGP